ncbi:caspase-1-like [Pundamilia nyererei]|uniref:Caspase-1-like n=1 Tax=Pundamilia nyererei TaxID=303518 RepID=A0A9Y3S8Z5_9CICH|nr:PREDICTED: caspase-1-like [Pundamilia nyererei]
MAMSTDNMTRNIQATNVPRRTKRVALLINNMHFYNPALTRHGADKDEQAVVNLLHTLGYEVDRHRNLPAQKMDEALKRFSRRPTLPLTDSVFVVVMSHGGMGTICGTGNHRIEIDRIYERLNSRNCPALKDKPKIVIIQASRGVLVPGRPPVPTDNMRARSVNEAARLHTEKDFITLHCSAPHIAAYKHPAYGSFFIQSIAEVFSSRCVQDPIDELFKKVRSRIF